MEAYRPLPYVYVGILTLWLISGISWTTNTWKRRLFQKSHLQWMLAWVLFIKVLQSGLSFLVWYSCFNLRTCSLWASFGVYITEACFHVACFISFLLISHGYCITCQHLPIFERRLTASIGILLYTVLIGCKVEVPYFRVLLLFTYFTSFCIVFHHVSENLVILRQHLSFTESEGIVSMHDAVHAKYIMFRKFQGAMTVLTVAKIWIYMDVDGIKDTFWFHLLVREVALFGILFYIGWTFRSKEVPLHFTIMPTLKCEVQKTLPLIYKLELDSKELNNLDFHEWHIGVPTGFPDKYAGNSATLPFVMVRNPRASM